MPLSCRIIPYLLVVFFLSGCAANDLVVKRQAEAETKIEFLLQSSKKAEQRQNEFAAIQQIQGRQLQSLTGEIRQLRDENSGLIASRDELAAKVAGLVRQRQTPTVEIINQPSPAKTSRDPGPPPEYLKAFGLYSANNFQEAIGAFESFLKNNPQSDYAANAVYWIGECHYTLSDLPRAKEAFLRVTEEYPKSAKMPDALLKLGYTLAALKEKDKAIGIFERIIASYPGSSAAAKARERLNAH